MRVLIVGGGVAGVAAAISLKKIGWDPVVFEGYANSADGVGAFLMLATNGFDALEALGAKEQVKRRGNDTPRMSFFSHTGRKLGTAAFGGRHADGTVTQMIDRAELYSALISEAEESGVTIEYGKRFTGLKHSDDGVRIEFEDGSYADGDLLVGADGLRSAVRQVIDPEAPEPNEIASVSAGGVADPIEVPGEVGEWRVSFGRGCFFGYTKRPDNYVAWFVNPPIADLDAAIELAELTEEQWRARLIEMVENDRTPAADIVRASSEIYPPGIDHAFPPTRQWFADRVVLVGDAAHPTPPAGGQGASMALEDAVVLARCLRDIDDHQVAFETFAKIRRPRVIDVIASAEKINFSQQAMGAVGTAIRNVAVAIALWNDQRHIRKTGHARTTESMQWIWSHHLDWDEKAVPLP